MERSKEITLPNGNKVTGYYVSTLAARMGKSVHSIRKWEVYGIIPKPLFLGAEKRRLYLEDEIQIFVDTMNEVSAAGKTDTLKRFKSKLLPRIKKFKLDFCAENGISLPEKEVDKHGA